MNFETNDNMESIFEKIYKTDEWGKKLENAPLMSGPGSRIEYNKDYITFLRKYILLNNIRNIVDLGCGDWRFSDEIYRDMTNITYIGLDCVKPVIEQNIENYGNNKRYTFMHFDIYNNRHNIPNADLFLIKDVLQHYSNEQTEILLKYLIHTYPDATIIITNCCNDEHVNRVVPTGLFYPFNPEHTPLVKFHIEELLRYKTKRVHLVTGIKK